MEKAPTDEEKVSIRNLSNHLLPFNKRNLVFLHLRGGNLKPMFQYHYKCKVLLAGNPPPSLARIYRYMANYSLESIVPVIV